MNIGAIDKAEKFVLTHLDSASSVLIAMGIMGTVTSSLAQQVALKRNKELPNDKKNFLIGQEQRDCVLNASLTLISGKYAQKAITALTNNGYLLNNSVRELSDKIAAEHNISHRELAKDGFYKMPTEREENLDKYVTSLKEKYPLKERISKFLHLNNVRNQHAIQVKPAPKQNAIPNISSFPELKQKFIRCQEGLRVIGAVLAAITTTNLLVPIFRNLLVKKDNPKNNDTNTPSFEFEKVLTEKYIPQTFKNTSKTSDIYQNRYSSNLRI